MLYREINFGIILGVFGKLKGLGGGSYAE